MNICYILFLLIEFIYSIDEWVPKFVNQSRINEPFDYIDSQYLPEIISGQKFDWISISGTTSKSNQYSYVAFGGVQTNDNLTSDISVYRKKSGVIVVCTNNQLNSDIFNTKLNCKIVKETNIFTSDYRYLGKSLKTVPIENENAVLMFCDPLWISKSLPAGICELVELNGANFKSKAPYQVCIDSVQCMAGFSLDLQTASDDVDVILGLPFANKTLFCNGVMKNQLQKCRSTDGDNFNFGYSVAIGMDSSQVISSPNPGPSSAFVRSYPKRVNISTNEYSGFGMSIDTLKVSFNVATIIGAPYQRRLNKINVGAVYLWCNGLNSDVVYGEEENMYFGYAVSRISDVNDDNIDDFAVSAPNIIPSDKRPGKIFIYTVTADCKINKVPIQVYEDTKRLPGFGIAISRSFDLDFDESHEFFVSSLDSTKPTLFSMPKKVIVSCSMHKLNDILGLLKRGQSYSFLVNLQSQVFNLDLTKYQFQVKLDTYFNSMKREIHKRFELEKIQYLPARRQLEITLKMNKDVVEMDLAQIPLEVAVRMIRPCKTEAGGCSKQDQMKTAGSIRMSHILMKQCSGLRPVHKPCTAEKCQADLQLTIKPDAQGNLLKYGHGLTVSRTLETIITSLDETQPAIYLEIRVMNTTSLGNDTGDGEYPLKIDHIRSDQPSQLDLSSNGQYAKLLIKNNYEVTSKIVIKLLYQPSSNKSRLISSSLGVEMRTWGIYSDSKLDNNKDSYSYQVIFDPKLKISIQKTNQDLIIDKRTRPPYFTPGSVIEVHELGTFLEFNYIIENKGVAMNNVTMKFTWPYRTNLDLVAKDDYLSGYGVKHQWLVYSVDRIREAANNNWAQVLPTMKRQGKPVGQCSLVTIRVSEAKFLVNPFKMRPYESHDEAASNTTRKSATLRVKRSIDANSPDNNNQEGGSSATTATSTGTESNTVTIKCGHESQVIGKPICAQAVCKLDEIPKNSVYNFNFRAWLYTKTFFDNNLPDIKISVNLESDLGELPVGIKVANNQVRVGPVEQVQQVLFKNMKLPTKKVIPLWSLILAILIGLLILVVIIIIAYYCGFFKRKRIRKERKQLRADNDAAVTNGQHANTEPEDKRRLNA